MPNEIDPNLQKQVDQQLMEQGVFTPLELLLNSGRLSYNDYESWRKGELPVLEQAFLGSPKRIRKQIGDAISYATAIKLEAQSQSYHPWGNSSATLKLSDDADLHHLLSQRYSAPQDAPQMDMFFDNPVVVLVNAICDAVVKRDTTQAQQQLDQLYEQAPNHADLAVFDLMMALLTSDQQPIVDAADHLAKLKQISPHAKRLLSNQSRDFLVPQWRKLAAHLAEGQYLPSQPELHSSYALAQAQDWLAVSQAIHAVPQWWQFEPLCLRLADCGYRRGDRAEALTAWFHICWQWPDVADQVLDGGQWPDMNVRGLWYRFWESEEDLELEEGWKTEEFPAWVMLAEPGLSALITAKFSTNQQVYCAAHELAATRLQSQDELLARKKLQQLHLGLFAFWKNRFNAL